MGKDLTEIALAKGDRVVATSRNLTSLSSLEPLKSTHTPNSLLTIQLDVTNPAEISNAFFEAKQVFGRVDVVFNNAAVGLFGEVEGTPDEVARAVFETNFWGGANVAREAVKFFREVNPPGEGGRLISVSSYGGTVPLGGAGYYCAAKAGA